MWIGKLEISYLVRNFGPIFNQFDFGHEGCFDPSTNLFASLAIMFIHPPTKPQQLSRTDS